ncbi:MULTISPECIES: hypothetical protein [Streptomyces]|uniref:Uncharacterized protein n=2 Tax=Streptomyces TaxID=1883 RepID=A0ABU4JYY9_9ACTN|nr:hypothetical protein [Streptomyces roseolus]MDX2290713.1 hypothetical protein [Streptomyces roseolus]
MEDLKYTAGRIVEQVARHDMSVPDAIPLLAGLGVGTEADVEFALRGMINGEFSQLDVLVGWSLL